VVQYTREWFFQQGLDPVVKLVASVVLSSGGGRRHIGDIAKSLGLKSSDVDLAARRLRQFDINCAADHNYIEVPEGSQWLAQFSQVFPWRTEVEQEARRVADEEQRIKDMLAKRPPPAPPLLTADNDDDVVAAPAPTAATAKKKRKVFGR
jgi:hypothetical protein